MAKTLSMWAYDEASSSRSIKVSIGFGERHAITQVTTLGSGCLKQPRGRV